MVMIEVNRELDSVGGQLLSQLDPTLDARERFLAPPVLHRVCEPALVEGVTVDY